MIEINFDNVSISYYDALMWSAMWVLPKPIHLTEMFWRSFLRLRRNDIINRILDNNIYKSDIYLLYHRCSQVIDMSDKDDFWIITWLDFEKAIEYVEVLRVIYETQISNMGHAK